MSALKLSEASWLLGVEWHTAARWIKSGKLRPVPGAKPARISIKEIERMVGPLSPARVQSVRKRHVS
jgi:predicted site-specific integrase-resolvase